MRIDDDIRKKCATMRKAFFENERRTYELLSMESVREEVEKCMKIRKKPFNRNLLKMAIENMEKNGIRVFLCDTVEEAQETLLREVDGEKIVVKSKSCVGRELGLPELLEKHGIEVIETDLADRILQMMKETPVHPTGPSSHICVDDIAEKIIKKFGRIMPPDPMEIMEFVRDDVVRKIRVASVGITGVNAISAREGALILVHNEGNISLLTTDVKKHIAITGVEKICECMEDAISVAKVQAIFGTGSRASSYINIITGPSKTADIEKKLLMGMYGPSDICIILLDNGRSKRDERLLKCINCGFCLVVCPVYLTVGVELGGVYQGIRGALIHKDFEKIYMCTLCGRCERNCPVGVNFIDLIKENRKICWELEKMPMSLKEVVKNAKESGDIYRKKFNLKINGSHRLFIGCQYRNSHILTKIIDVCNMLNIDIDIQEEKCCGYPADAIGADYDWLGDFKKCITICPACTIQLRKYEVNATHLIEIIKDSIPNKDKLMMTAAYHDPCDMVKLGITEEPRKIIKKIVTNYVELKHNNENTFCCGGGGAMSGFNADLSEEVTILRLKECVDSDCDYLITSCPTCEIILTSGSFKHRKMLNKRIKVMSIWELIYRYIHL